MLDKLRKKRERKQRGVPHGQLRKKREDLMLIIKKGSLTAQMNKNRFNSSLGFV